MAAVGALPVPWALRAAVGVWFVFCALYVRRGGVADPLGFVWPLWWRGPYLRACMAALEAWLVPWVPYGRRSGVARPLGFVWPP